MHANGLQTELAKKGAKIEKLTEGVIRRPHLLHEAFDGLGADTARVKYGCLKVLRIVSERGPDMNGP